MGGISIQTVTEVEERVLLVSHRGRSVLLLGTRGGEADLDPALRLVDVLLDEGALNADMLIVDIATASVRPSLGFEDRR